MKAWWESKTIIANLIAILAGLLSELAGWFDSVGLESGWILALLGVLNVVLRLITDQPIGKNPWGTDS